MRTATQLLALGQLLALAVETSAQNATVNATLAIIANLEHYWSYGRSPPVYPSRKMLFILQCQGSTDAPQHRVLVAAIGLLPMTKHELSLLK